MIESYFSDDILLNIIVVLYKINIIIYFDLHAKNKCCSNAIQNDGNNELLPSLHFRHTALLRNKRCVLAYLYHRIKRLRQLRWELGSILPTEITANLLNAEVQWFQNYNKSLATYMRSIGDDHGLNLTVNMNPPKTLYVEVSSYYIYIYI